MSYRTNRPLLLSLFCATLASCSVVDGELAHVPTPASAGKATADKVAVAPHSRAKAYAFSERKPVAVVMEQGDAAPVEQDRPAYMGSAPYVCSPSGFGHKAQCFLR